MFNAKDNSVDRVLASGVVSRKPCFVHSICGIGLAETSNVYTVYDGHEASGKAKFRLVAGSYSPDFRLFAPPMFFARGVYIAFTTNGEECVVQYKQQDE